MKITFAWTLADGQSLPEERFLSRIEEIRTLNADGINEGSLILPNEGGLPPIELGDQLAAIVVEVCIIAAGELIAGRSKDLEFFAADADARLAIEGDQIVLTGTGLDEAHYPREEFIPALLDCADRFVAFFRVLWEGESGWLEYADQWARSTAENRAAWAAGNSPAATA